jgi:predicted component of type VI protein secretion system
LIGRNPREESGEVLDHHVIISDPGRTVSKTHLEFGQEHGALWVRDRFSGNGTSIVGLDNAQRRLDAGKRYLVGRGMRVYIGEQYFYVR